LEEVGDAARGIVCKILRKYVKENMRLYFPTPTYKGKEIPIPP